MKKTFIILALLASIQVQAQFIKERAIDVSIGMGLSAPNDQYDIYGTGFYLQGEYVLSPANWIDIRPYAGFILANNLTAEQEETGFTSTANTFLFGGKTRITAPISWVAPYIEVGVGASIGSFETFTPYTDIEDRGLFLHIPFSLGLELGPGHNVNIEFNYYFHQSVEQFGGAAAIGISFPLNSN